MAAGEMSPTQRPDGASATAATPASCITICSSSAPSPCHVATASTGRGSLAPGGCTLAVDVPMAAGHAASLPGSHIRHIPVDPASTAKKAEPLARCLDFTGELSDDVPTPPPLSAVPLVGTPSPGETADRSPVNRRAPSQSVSLRREICGVNHYQTLLVQPHARPRAETYSFIVVNEYDPTIVYPYVILSEVQN